VGALVRARISRRLSSSSSRKNRAEAARILAQPERIGVDADVIQRKRSTAVSGFRLTAPCAKAAAICWWDERARRRPDPVQAAWLYAQMVRWGQASISPEALKTAMGVFRPDLYDAALGRKAKPVDTSGAIGAFAGPAFDADDIARASGSVQDRASAVLTREPMEQC